MNINYKKKKNRIKVDKSELITHVLRFPANSDFREFPPYAPLTHKTFNYKFIII